MVNVSLKTPGITALLKVTQIRRQIITNIDPMSLPSPFNPGANGQVNWDLGAWNFSWELRGVETSLADYNTLRDKLIGSGSLFAACVTVRLNMPDDTTDYWTDPDDALVATPVWLTGFIANSHSDKGGEYNTWENTLKLVQGTLFGTRGRDNAIRPSSACQERLLRQGRRHAEAVGRRISRYVADQRRWQLCHRDDDEPDERWAQVVQDDAAAGRSLRAVHILCQSVGQCARGVRALVGDGGQRRWLWRQLLLRDKQHDRSAGAIQRRCQDAGRHHHDDTDGSDDVL